MKNHNIVKRDQIRKPHSGIGSAGYNKASFKKGSGTSTRNENIISAIIMLMKELDKSSLEVIQKEAEKRINEIQ